MIRPAAPPLPFVFALLALGQTVCALHGQGPSQQPDAAAWRHDVEYLARALEATHPAPFAHVERTRFEKAAATLVERLPELTHNQRFVELQRLIALLGDAHSQLIPVQPALDFHYYPFELYHFEDGLFVRRAAPELEALVGARVVRFGERSAEEALSAAATIVSHENEGWTRAWGPVWLTVPEIVHGLDLVANPQHLTLVVERAGKSETVTVGPSGRLSHGGHRPGLPIDRSGWLEMREGPEPLWERHPDRLFWFEKLGSERALYVSYRAVVSPPHGPSNEELWNQVFAEIDGSQPRRVILDLRENTGGNGFYNRHVIRQILRRPDLDRAGALYVVIGRLTFSAAQQLANDLEWWTEAIFVGEPTGQMPSQYGDHETITLPATGIEVRISTVFHQAPNPLDRRRFVPPDVYAPLGSEDYRQGRDPALEAALSHQPRSPIAERIESLVKADRADEAGELLSRESQALENRFQPIEAEINALGYRLLSADQVNRALTVFELNTRVFPDSANVHDSLGEALLVAGRREEAIESYRRALEIDPEFPTALQALERLTHP